MQGSQGCIALAGGGLLFAFWSCSFPNYGFVEESGDRTGGEPGSQMAAGGDANGGEANAGAAGQREPSGSGGQAGEEPSVAGSSGSDSGSAGGAPLGADPALLCKDFDTGPADCDCFDYHEHAYLFCGAALSWWDAAEQCEAAGTKLLAVQGPEENTWVVSRVTELEGSFSSQNFWIGGKSEGDSWVFRWPDQSAFWVGQSDGTPAEGGYANWRNTNPKQGGCVSMNTDGWEDGNCEDLRPYLCEAY